MEGRIIINQVSHFSAATRFSFTPPSTDVSRIQIMMGHRSLSTTLGYLHVTRSGLSKIASPLDFPDEEVGDEK